LERCFKSPGIRALKLHPAFHGYPVSGERYRPAYEFAQDRELAILNHDWGSAENLSNLATKYPKAKFIQAHTAGWWNGVDTEKYFELARELDNVYLDLAASIAYDGAFERILELVPFEKLLYGSDSPYMDMGYQIGRILFAGMPFANKKKIFGENARRLLRISNENNISIPQRLSGPGRCKM
jgi:predicted TIM-barrel fold metal-dependent hydrolase